MSVSYATFPKGRQNVGLAFPARGPRPAGSNSIVSKVMDLLKAMDYENAMFHLRNADACTYSRILIRSRSSRPCFIRPSHRHACRKMPVSLPLAAEPRIARISSRCRHRPKREIMEWQTGAVQQPKSQTGPGPKALKPTGTPTGLPTGRRAGSALATVVH